MHVRNRLALSLINKGLLTNICRHSFSLMNEHYSLTQWMTEVSLTPECGYRWKFKCWTITTQDCFILLISYYMSIQVCFGEGMHINAVKSSTDNLPTFVEVFWVPVTLFSNLHKGLFPLYLALTTYNTSSLLSFIFESTHDRPTHASGLSSLQN